MLNRIWEFCVFIPSWSVTTFAGSYVFQGMYVDRCDNNHVSAQHTGQVRTTADAVEAEPWEIEEAPDGGFLLVSSVQGRQLYCDTKGNLSASLEDCQGWRFEPRMPGSISGPRLAALSGAGVAAAALVVAAPFLAVAWFGIGAEISAAMGGGALVGTVVVGTTAAVVGAKTSSRTNTVEEEQDVVPIPNRPLVGWRSW
jgi:hypothetical protein